MDFVASALASILHSGFWPWQLPFHPQLQTRPWLWLWRRHPWDYGQAMTMEKSSWGQAQSCICFPSALSICKEDCRAGFKLTQLECPWKKTGDKSGALEHTGKQFSFPYRARFGTAVETAATALRRGDGHGGLCRSTPDVLPENAPILPATKADGIYSWQFSGWLQAACKCKMCGLEGSLDCPASIQLRHG